MISIIVPIYNAVKWLPKCIESVLAQTYSDLEVILVDDGSTDRSGEICDEYASKDRRIRVIHKQNEGRNAARLDGFKNSRGEWIMFVDADDVLMPNAIEDLVAVSKDVDMVAGAVEVCDENMESPRQMPKHIIKDYDWSAEEYINSLILGKCRIALWGSIYKRELINEIALALPKEIFFSEDIILQVRFGLRGKRFRGVNNLVYKYRYYPTNTVNTFKTKLSYLYLISQYLEDSISMYCDSNSFKESIFRYRLSNVMNSLVEEEDYTDQDIYKTILHQKKNYKLSIKEKFFFMISKLPSHSLTVGLWRSYQWISVLAYKILL